MKAAKTIWKIIEPKTCKKPIANHYAKVWQQTIKDRYIGYIESGKFGQKIKKKFHSWIDRM